MKTATLQTRQKLFDTLKEKDTRIAIFDNGGETVDRYTIYFTIEGDQYTAARYTVTCSDNPSEPGGMWQHMGNTGISMHEDQKQRLTSLDIPELIALQIIRELTED